MNSCPKCGGSQIEVVLTAERNNPLLACKDCSWQRKGEEYQKDCQKK